MTLDLDARTLDGIATLVDKFAPQRPTNCAARRRVWRRRNSSRP